MADIVRRARTVVPKGAKSALARGMEQVGEWTSALRLLPTFQVAGAQRSGSSALYEYLVRHPLVGRALVEEIHFFDNNFQRGIDWYRGHFPTALRAGLTKRAQGRSMICGEATPYYLAHPLAPARLAATLPDSRVVIVLRDPVARAYSHYNHEVALGAETLSFDRALDREPERLAGEVDRMIADPSYYSYAHQQYSYVERGRYAEQIERLWSLLPREQVLVIHSRDLGEETDRVYQQVLSFLGLPVHSLGSYPRVSARRYPPMSDATRARLRSEFREPNERLFDLIGSDLGWNDRPAGGS
jgi:hypothetical protein